jgi:hypothetical protein
MITLVEPSISFLPAFNRINFDISSSNATAVGFKYAVKVYNADTASLVTTAYYDTAINPFSPITFDVSRLLIEGYEFNELLPNANKWEYNECILNRFYLKCYEYYDVLGNGIYEIDLATEVVSNTYTCFAGSFNFIDRPLWNTTYFDGTDAEWYPLTDQLNFKLHQDFFKVFTFYNPNDDITDIVITRYDTTGTTTYTELPTLNAGGDDLTHFTFSPTDYGVNSNTLYFKLHINGTISSNDFATITMYNCKKYEVKNLVWINRYGTLDSYSFVLASRKDISVERKMYQRDYTGYGQDYDNPYNVFQNTSPVFYTKETQVVTLNTDYITDVESIIFRQLYTSPFIYLYAEGDYNYANLPFPSDSFVNTTQQAFLPVKLKSDSYEIKQKINEKLFQIQAQFEYSEPSYRQIV